MADFLRRVQANRAKNQRNVRIREKTKRNLDVHFWVYL